MGDGGHFSHATLTVAGGVLERIGVGGLAWLWTLFAYQYNKNLSNLNFIGYRASLMSERMN